MRPEVTGYRVESDTSIVVEYDLHRPAGVAVVCRISALDGGRNRVGTVEDTRARAGAQRRCTGWCPCAPACGPSPGVVDSCTRVLDTP